MTEDFEWMTLTGVEEFWSNVNFSKYQHSPACGGIFDNTSLLQYETNGKLLLHMNRYQDKFHEVRRFDIDAAARRTLR